MKQYNVVMLGDKEALAIARAYSQKVLPFTASGEPSGWVFSKENVKYVGECVVLKAISRKIAAEALRGIEGLLVLNPSASKLEVN